MVKELLQSHRELEWSNLLVSMVEPGTGWSNLYKLNKRLLRKFSAVQSLTNPNGALVSDPADKNEIFAKTT